MTTNNPHGVTERLSAAMREAQEEFARAFPGAERAVLIAQWWGGKLDLQGQVKTGQVWHTGSRLSGAENIDAAIKAVRMEMGDAHRLRLEAADLIRRALIIEGGGVMSYFDQPKYRIDGAPASANDLINRASELDETYGSDGIKWTSRAANILRNYGHVVDHNPDFKEEAQS